MYGEFRLRSQQSIWQFGAVIELVQGAVQAMDALEKILDKVTDWVRKLIEALLSPDAQPEAELIPIPIDDRTSRH
ncbi:hypothetical protein [Neosynechococcus sphagnicola]|nr:hypothetical protein [Neosynechococcus sphagnicola]